MSQFRKAIREGALPLASPRDLEPLLERARRARTVMLGEATHGTREFHEWRRVISMALIERHGFNFIAIEGDWPPAMAVHRLIRRSALAPSDLRDALQSFSRWPTWMWSNRETLALVEKLRHHNEAHLERPPVGFFGLDIYSLYESLDAVLAYLSEAHPLLARRARARYECFEPYARNELAYARSLAQSENGCEEQAVRTLQDLLAARLHDDGEGLFDARQNARIVRDAEAYYRSLVTGDGDSWNLRDRHMLGTLEQLTERYGPGIVWAHNTHVGDYRATDMAREGLENLGGLARERWGDEAVCLVGFGTHHGTVIASSAWDGPTLELNVPSAMPGSLEAALHEAAVAEGAERLLYVFGERDRAGPLAEPHGHRAIGVVYVPACERWRQYVPTALARRYDAFVFVDRTSALKPLDTAFRREEMPEAWPAGY